jgi:hypothetical protein
MHVSARSNGFPLSLFIIPSARLDCVAHINLSSAGSYSVATHSACSSMWLRSRTLRHVCPSWEGSILTNGGVCGALYAWSLLIGFLWYTEPHWTQPDTKELVYLIQCRDKTYPFVTFVSEGNQEWPQGRTQPVLIECRWNIEWYCRGSREPLDNWKPFIKTFRPSVCHT